MSFSQPQLPSLPVETIWFGSMDLISAAVSLIHSANSSLFSSEVEKHRGSLQICQAKIAGSSLYAVPVTELIRETTVLTWSAKRSFALSSVMNFPADSIYAGQPSTAGITAFPYPAHSRYCPYPPDHSQALLRYSTAVIFRFPSSARNLSRPLKTASSYSPAPVWRVGSILVGTPAGPSPPASTLRLVIPRALSESSSAHSLPMSDEGPSAASRGPYQKLVPI